MSIGDIYRSFLWFCGFQEGETISAMLARQKQRLGSWWYVLPAVTILFALGVVIFLGWLLWHILTFKLRDSENE